MWWEACVHFPWDTNSVLCLNHVPFPLNGLGTLAENPLTVCQGLSLGSLAYSIGQSVCLSVCSYAGSTWL